MPLGLSRLTGLRRLPLLSRPEGTNWSKSGQTPQQVQQIVIIGIIYHQLLKQA